MAGDGPGHPAELLRGLSRTELLHGNRERPSSWLKRDPEANIVLWAWTAYEGTRARYLPLVGRPWFVRLAGRRPVARWLGPLSPA